MKVQTSDITVEYDCKGAARFLSQILPDVKEVDTVKHVTQYEVVTVSVGWRIFWVIFWILVFWPLAFVAVFIAGKETNLAFSDGQYNVTLNDGTKLILTGNEECLLTFVQEARNKNFLK